MNLLIMKKKIFYDYGKDWQSLTSFGPMRYGLRTGNETQNVDNHIFKDGDLIFNVGNEFISIKGLGRLRYKDKI